MALFREYDIRGVVGQELTTDMAEKIGQAYATMGVEKGLNCITVGRDGRTSSPMLRDSLVKGLLAGGLDVIDVGVCSSPVLYFSVFHLKVDGGIMITGSHNAGEYNGFKLCVGKTAIHGQDIQDLHKIIQDGTFATGAGAVRFHPIIPDYLEYLKEAFDHVDGRGLHVVVDCGNGAASLMAKEALEQMGCRVTGLYCELDGRFPNHHPDPTVTENLQDLIDTVKKEKADLGIGYDGDADRIGAVDEQGQILWGDRLMVIYSRDILRSNPGSAIISEVKASQFLYDDIERQGGRPIMWKTGHSLIKAKMKEEKALLAGEMSGHMFFADRYFGFDDAVYASCRLVEILASRKQTVSSLTADLPSTAVTPEIRVDCEDHVKFDIVTRVIERFKHLARAEQPPSGSPSPIRKLVTIDGIRIVFEDGWGLIRASNTQPALVLRFEASTSEQLDGIRNFVERELLQVREGIPS